MPRWTHVVVADSTPEDPVATRRHDVAVPLVVPTRVVRFRCRNDRRLLRRHLRPPAAHQILDAHALFRIRQRRVPLDRLNGAAASECRVVFHGLRRRRRGFLRHDLVFVVLIILVLFVVQIVLAVRHFGIVVGVVLVVCHRVCV